MAIALVVSIAVFLPPVIANEAPSAVPEADDASKEKPKDDGTSLDSTEQLIAEVARLAPTVKDLRSSKPDYGVDNPIDNYFPAACNRADEKQLQELFDIYTGLPQFSLQRMHFLPPIARRRIELEVEKIKTEKARVSLPEIKAEAPAELRKGPAELIAAWQLHQRATVAYDKTFPRDTERNNKIDAYANDKSFQGLIRKAFFEKEKGVEKELGGYADTGAGCLDIRDIGDAQDFANLVVLLRERRLDEAVGAALRVAGTQGSISSPEVCAPAVIEFLKICGIDWETLFAGAHLSASLGQSDYSDSTPFVEALARYGTTRAATLANQLSLLAGARARERFVQLFNFWIGDSPTARKCKGQKVDVGSRSWQSWRPAPVSVEVQHALLSTTEEFIAPDCSESLARSALHIFGRTQSRSSIPALRQLALHDDKDVARDAAIVLCAMDESVPAITVGQPVRFRLSVNGKPLPLGDHIGYRIVTETNSNTSSAVAGPDGIVELERRWFTHPTKRPTRIEFDHFGGDDAGIPQFNATVPPPVNLDGITPVEIKASALELHLRNVARLKAPLPEKTKLYILPADGPELQTLFKAGAHELDVMVGESISVPLLEDKVYDVGLALPGAERWRARVVVGPDAEPVEVELKPGSDVHCKVVSPTGETIAPSELIKDGYVVKQFQDYETQTYRALGLGNYVLRIYGSQHWKRPDERRGPDEVAVLGRDVPFTISESSPALLDLGEIHLEPDNQ